MLKCEYGRRTTDRDPAPDQISDFVSIVQCTVQEIGGKNGFKLAKSFEIGEPTMRAAGLGGLPFGRYG